MYMSHVFERSDAHTLGSSVATFTTSQDAAGLGRGAGHKGSGFLGLGRRRMGLERGRQGSLRWLHAL